MKIFAWLVHIVALVFLAGCRSTVIEVPESPYPMAEDAYSMRTVVDGFVIPYGLAIVDDDEYFVTDRIGKLFHVVDGVAEEIEGTPDVATFGVSGIPVILHGGLMDASLHPDFETNGWLYVAYLAADGLAKVSRLQVVGGAVANLETVFATRRENYTGNGMRIVWQDDTHFFLNVGNSDWSTKSSPVLYAQDLEDDAGKIHRLNDDGSVPLDNPVFEGKETATTIWSYGHRDVQGLVWDELSQVLLGVEHGPKGGDEFNVIEKGQNYGWPLFSYGINYDGAQVSMISAAEAATFTVLPEHYWTVPTRDGGQAIAPASLAYVGDSNIADWNGHFLMGSLAYRRLMKYNRETRETFGLGIEGRVRTVKQLPGGDILVLVERSDLELANGKILRISR